MTTGGYAQNENDRSRSPHKQEDLTNMQARYSELHIRHYEFVWGESWCSPGGESMTGKLLDEIEALRSPSAAQNAPMVLDVGSGNGGASFLMAEKYGAKVVGVDIATAMVKLANEYLEKYLAEGDERAKKLARTPPSFVCADCMDASQMPASCGEGSFDVIWCRDSFLHIPRARKPELFRRLLALLRPGGQLFFTDYGKGPQPLADTSVTFQHYNTKKGYDLMSPQEYADIIKGAGFERVVADDKTLEFTQLLKKERADTEGRRAAFEEKFDAESYESLVAGWDSKIGWTQAGEMKWVQVSAFKPK